MRTTPASTQALKWLWWREMPAQSVEKDPPKVLRVKPFQVFKSWLDPVVVVTWIQSQGIRNQGYLWVCRPRRAAVYLTCESDAYQRDQRCPPSTVYWQKRDSPGIQAPKSTVVSSPAGIQEGNVKASCCYPGTTYFLRSQGEKAPQSPN